MHRVRSTPRPATKFSAAVIFKGLVNFSLGVHHKRTVLRHRFANRARLQHQQLHRIAARVVDVQVVLGHHLDDRTLWHVLSGELQTLARKEIQLPFRAGVNGAR